MPDARCRMPDEKEKLCPERFSEELIVNSEKVKIRTLSCTDFFGDPDENRTRVTAVKGRCLNRLTTGPYSIVRVKTLYKNTLVGRCVELVAAVGFEPTTNRV